MIEAKIIIPDRAFDTEAIAKLTGTSDYQSRVVTVDGKKELYVRGVTQDALDNALSKYDHAAVMREVLEKDVFRKLRECDWTVLSDGNPPGGQAAWLNYRQTLRDLPQSASDPVNPIWPAKPW